ncbi:hypothetical protein Tco_0696058 [Tanacetum coccineum]
MDWYCSKQGITELTQKDLEGPAYEIVKVFHPNVIHLEFQIEECHKLLTDQGNDAILRYNVNKPLPLGGEPGHVMIQSNFFFNKDLKYLRYGRNIGRLSKMKAAYYPDVGLEEMVPDQMWIEEECKYDIAVMYGISHWWFQRQRFYINRHTSEGDRRAIHTYIRILSVVRIEVFSLYGYDYMKKIVLRRADLKDHIIAEKDFKYLYPSDFEDLYFLNLQETWLSNNASLGIESYQTQLNLTKPRWDVTSFEYKHDFIVIDSPRAVTFRDKYGVKMIMRFNDIHKFSDGTLQQIDEALDYRVKEFKVNRMNLGLNTRFWTKKDVDRSKEFMFAIQKRLKTRRIFRNLECFVGGRRSIHFYHLSHSELDDIEKVAVCSSLRLPKNQKCTIESRAMRSSINLVRTLIQTMLSHHTLRLISWQCKKQIIMATSTTEAEYVVVANCCGQFWNTATSKTVNDVSYIKAKVAGKTVSISEASIRQDLLFNDVDGIDCLTNQEIYENLQLMGNLDAKKQFLMYPRFVQVFLNNQLSNLPAPLDNLPIPVLTKKVFTNIAKQGLHFSGHVTPLFPNMLAQALVDEGEDPRKNLEGTSGSQGDHVQIPHDSPLSGGHTSDRAKGGLNLDELLVLCTNLSNRVLALETSKDAQAAEILNLKTRIKKLEKKCKPSISHHRAWLRSVSRLSRKKKLCKKESVSKQGRKNTKSGPKLDDNTFDDLDADLAYGMDYMETEEAMNDRRQTNETEEINLDAEDKGSGEKGGSTVSTARPEVDTARLDIDTARPEVHTANAPVSTAGVTISTADPKMKEEKAKEKGVAFKDVEDSSRPVRSITTLKPLPSINPKDKGKGILVEEEPVKIKRKDQGIDQIERDEELAHKLHEEELAEIARIKEEKEAQEEASRVAIMEMFDEIQTGIDADALFAAKLQQEEREEYTIEERAQFLAETIAAQRKFRAAQKVAEIRSRPPTKS